MAKKDIRDLDDCHNKIKALLKEYGCQIEFDEEVQDVIIFDLETMEFKHVN
jgi:hypothetical protein